ncbi:hypothetical protein D9M70_510050 [compost metagenome]
MTANALANWVAWRKSRLTPVALAWAPLARNTGFCWPLEVEGIQLLILRVPSAFISHTSVGCGAGMAGTAFGS